jgi:hypothetical protein
LFLAQSKGDYKIQLSSENKLKIERRTDTVKDRFGKLSKHCNTNQVILHVCNKAHERINHLRTASDNSIHGHPLAPVAHSRNIANLPGLYSTATHDACGTNLKGWQRVLSATRPPCKRKNWETQKGEVGQARNKARARL